MLRLRISCVVPLVLALASVVLLGCSAKYHHIKDPATGNTYYTQDLDRHGDSVRFTDANTGARVSLPSSEVLEVNEEEFMANTPKRD